MIDDGYVLTVFAWLLTLAVLLGRAWGVGRPVAGLSLAYWLNLSLIHLISGIIQAFPWYKSPHREESILGFKVTGYAVIGLLVGNAVIAPLIVPASDKREPSPSADVHPRQLAVRLIWAGVVCNFLLLGVLGNIPSLGAVVSGGLSLAVAGFCLLWWGYWRAGEKGKAWRVLCYAPLFPVLTLGLHGFLGAGVVVCLQLASFVAVFYRPRRTVILTGLVAVFLGLSLYPVYMRVRSEIRAAVWGGAGVEERLDRLFLLASEWEWFDSEKSSHLAAIDGRLNQNYLVGKAVRRTSAGVVAFAGGETLVDSLLALIPRAVWPDKPQWAGSGGLVSRFTGMHFARGTAVGIGHVMELYVNFGAAGVLCGYLVLGTLLGAIDLVAGRHLASGRWDQFVLWYMVGVPILNVGGNFAETTAAIAGAILLTLFVIQALASLGPRSRPVAQRG
jgi:hypothetical protein